MNRKLARLLSAAVCLCMAMCLLLTACGKDYADRVDALKEQMGKNTADPAVTDAADPTEPPADYSKYNTYIDLSDEMGKIEEVLGVYFQNVLYQEEFALAEGGDYAAIKDAVQFFTGLSYTVEKALDYADEEPFYPEADEAVLALGDSPSQVMTALDHLGSYMRFDDFVDDNLARAPELHAELWAALETYDAYYPAFLSALNDMAEASREDDLNELLEAGEMIRYNTRLMIQTAEDIQDGIWVQLEAAAAEADPDAELELPAIDTAELSPLFAKFQTAYEDLTAALADDAEKEKISVFTKKFGEESLKLYSNKVDTLYVKVGTLAQALLDGSDYADAYDEVGEAVSDMINTYNNCNT